MRGYANRARFQMRRDDTRAAEKRDKSVLKRPFEA